MVSKDISRTIIFVGTKNNECFTFPGKSRAPGPGVNKLMQMQGSSAPAQTARLAPADQVFTDPPDQGWYYNTQVPGHIFPDESNNCTQYGESLVT